MSETPLVFVVDDDASVRDAVQTLLKSVGLPSLTFESPAKFMEVKRPDTPCCLVLDVALPDSNGLDFQDQLAKAGIQLPIVFITAHGDIPMTSRAIKAGAVEFLTKPFQKDDLITAIREALDRDRAYLIQNAEISELSARFQKLTPREKEVMDLVVQGLMNKEVAAKLGLSEVTVKIHRGHAMQKMEADSFADLVRMADKLKSPFSQLSQNERFTA